ncbi:hypothetical protein MPER_13040 [Moniliophthora perniciosa FA553]|nr:hypothetical protein MPER_13040 [Moniliophthora perniciosa FA553]
MISLPQTENPQLSSVELIRKGIRTQSSIYNPEAFNLAAQAVHEACRTPYFYVANVSAADKLQGFLELESAMKTLADKAHVFSAFDTGHPTMLDHAIVSLSYIIDRTYKDTTLPAEDRARLHQTWNHFLILRSKIDMRLSLLGWGRAMEYLSEPMYH